MARLAALLVVLALFGSADAYYCGCFKNAADSSYLGLMCTAYYMPSSIVGWGSPVNTWFSVDCSSCSVDYNCSRGELGHRKVEGLPQPPRTEAEKLAIAAEQAKLKPSVARKDAATSMVVVQDQKRAQDKPLAAVAAKATGDPVLCCCYAKQEYYYTKGIHCDAINPQSGVTYCQSSEYGAQNIGQWYVSDMFGQQCYFIVGQQSSATGDAKRITDGKSDKPAA